MKYGGQSYAGGSELRLVPLQFLRDVADALTEAGVLTPQIISDALGERASVATSAPVDARCQAEIERALQEAADSLYARGVIKLWHIIVVMGPDGIVAGVEPLEGRGNGTKYE